MRFSWSLGPTLHQSTVVRSSRDAPPADCAWLGAKQRRYPAVSPSNPSIVLLLLAVADNILNLETMPFFDLKNGWLRSSDFRPKSDDSGHRVLKPIFFRSDFAYSDCMNKPTSYVVRFAVS